MSLCRQILKTPISFNNKCALRFVSQKISQNSNKMGLPRVFFDMTVDNSPVGRIVIEVSTFYYKFF